MYFWTRMCFSKKMKFWDFNLWLLIGASTSWVKTNVHSATVTYDSIRFWLKFRFRSMNTGNVIKDIIKEQYSDIRDSPVTLWWKVWHVRMVLYFSFLWQFLDIPSVAMIDYFLTLLTEDKQRCEWWLVAVKLVLVVSQPRHGKNLWHCGWLIWYSDLCERQQHCEGWFRH